MILECKYYVIDLQNVYFCHQNCYFFYSLCCVAQLVTCLTAGLGVASKTLARSHTFAEIDHKLISTAVLLPSADSRRVHEVLVHHLVKLAQVKSVVR